MGNSGEQNNKVFDQAGGNASACVEDPANASPTHTFPHFMSGAQRKKPHREDGPITAADVAGIALSVPQKARSNVKQVENSQKDETAAKPGMAPSANIRMISPRTVAFVASALVVLVALCCFVARYLQSAA